MILIFLALFFLIVVICGIVFDSTGVGVFGIVGVVLTLVLGLSYSPDLPPVDWQRCKKSHAEYVEIRHGKLIGDATPALICDDYRNSPRSPAAGDDSLPVKPLKQ